MKIIIKSQRLIRLINRVSRRWKSVLVTFDDRVYFEAKGKLMNAGIEHKTKVVTPNTGFKGMSGRLIRTYEIKVMEEEVHKAYQVIQEH